MSIDLGLFILRLVVGALLIGHGSQKLFGWFGGYGLEGTTGWLASFGLRPARFWAFVAGLVEFVGGLLVLLGLFNPLGSLAITASMLVAIGKVHWLKVWASEGGLELPLTNIAAVTAIALAGPGRYSLDAVLGTGLPMPWTFLIGLATVVIGVVIALVTAERTRPAELRGREDEQKAA